MKITNNNFHDEYELFEAFFKCNNCKSASIIQGYKFCPNCGVSIEWDLKEYKSQYCAKCNKKYIYEKETDISKYENVVIESSSMKIYYSFICKDCYSMANKENEDK